MARTRYYRIDTTISALFVLLLLQVDAQDVTPPMRRNISEVRYHFTTCGQTGSSGPEYSQCINEYNSIQSPITRDDLLVNFVEQGLDYYQGLQRFRVPRTGYYNVTVAGAAGGRGICSTTSGRGLVWRGRVFLSEDQDLFILVGQKGVGPCDEDAIREQSLSLCSSPPTNLSEAENCELELINWINSDPQIPDDTMSRNAVRVITGGGGGGGASFILPVTRSTESVNTLPIVIAPGGGGTAAVERHDFFDRVPRPGPANVSDDEQFVQLIDGQTISSPSYLNTQAGSRGFINSTENIASASIRPGAGGGWNAVVASTSVEGAAIRLDTQGGDGGQDCATLQRGTEFTPYVPIRNVNGGFGGGGGQCGGGGGGGGYTGGSVFASFNSIPSGGGYFLSPEEAGYNLNTISELSIELRSEEGGFVDIVPDDCGCAHDCVVIEEEFQCTCPTGFNLHPNKADCYQGSTVSITPLAPLRKGDITFTPVVLNSNKSINIFGMRVTLSHSEEGTSMTDWACSIFLIGKSNEVVAATETTTTRDNTTVLERLARVNNGNVNLPNLTLTHQALLPTPVTLAGVLLVSSGGCSLAEPFLELNISLTEPGVAALEEEDFTALNYSMAQILASDLLPTAMPPTSTSGSDVIPKSESTVIPTVVGVVVSFVIIVLVFAIGLVAFILYRNMRKGRLIEGNDSVHPRRKDNDYSSSLAPNAAYGGKNFTLINDSYHKEEVNRFYEPGPPSHAPLEAEGYESISYDTNGIKRRSMKRRTSINASARFFSPRHGISAPEHDFTPFNLHRSQHRDWEYPRKNLIYLKELGEGEFGKVLLMKAQGIADFSGEIPVAVKTLSFKNQHLLEKFMEEINLMKKFAHPNIVGLLGISTKDISQDSAPLMILEYMPFGDLQSFLTKHRPTILRKSQKRIGPAHFFSFSKDVAEALAFLASQQHVHRDIAARNCLVGAGLQVKIADFGMARHFANDKGIYKVEGKAVLPIRWLAPESLIYGIFSTASDVWSYGVLLWEIVTFGDLPLSNLQTNEIVELAQSQELAHSRPPRCPDEIYDVMCRCHRHEREDRITFDEIVEVFSTENILKLMGEKEIEISYSSH